MADGPPMPSPYVQEFVDNQTPQRRVRIAVTFNNATRSITGCSVFRDADCQWTKILLGLGADGTPDTTTRGFNVPAGTTNINNQQLSNRGFSTIEDVLALQITAGR